MEKSLKHPKEMNLVELVSEIIDLVKQGSEQKANQRMSEFEDKALASGRSNIRKAVSVIDEDSTFNKKPLAKKMLETLKNLIDL